MTDQGTAPNDGHRREAWDTGCLCPCCQLRRNAGRVSQSACSCGVALKKLNGKWWHFMGDEPTPCPAYLASRSGERERPRDTLATLEAAVATARGEISAAKLAELCGFKPTDWLTTDRLAALKAKYDELADRSLSVPSLADSPDAVEAVRKFVAQWGHLERWAREFAGDNSHAGALASAFDLAALLRAAERVSGKESR